MLVRSAPRLAAALHLLLPGPAPRFPGPRACSSFDDPFGASRSTARPEEERFAAGSAERAAALQAELALRGFPDAEALMRSDELRGTAALRTWTSFVYPKSEGALANAERPQRAATTAQQIAFFIRELRADRAAWLRNRDRALSEVRGERNPLTLVLDNVRSAHNVGNILRAAEASRATRVFHCGLTPVPPEPKLLKTAMGAAEYVPHEHAHSTLGVVRALQESGVQVWGCETSARSVPYPRAAPAGWPSPLALVLGNELIGVDTEVLDACDLVIEIPMHGVKNSLNVATAASILMWEALRRWDDA